MGDWYSGTLQCHSCRGKTNILEEESLAEMFPRLVPILCILLVVMCSLSLVWTETMVQPIEEIEDVPESKTENISVDTDPSYYQDVFGMVEKLLRKLARVMG